jgi:hypothetical protein
MNASTKTLIIFWCIFWASSFINSNIWHLIYNNFNLNFIYGIVCLYVCVFVHSRFIENPPIWSWETNPSFLRWFCHIAELDADGEVMHGLVLLVRELQQQARLPHTYKQGANRWIEAWEHQCLVPTNGMTKQILNCMDPVCLPVDPAMEERAPVSRMMMYLKR